MSGGVRGRGLITPSYSIYTAPAEPGRSRRGDDADKGVIACGIKTMSIWIPENLFHRQETDQKENRKDRKEYE